MLPSDFTAMDAPISTPDATYESPVYQPATVWSPPYVPPYQGGPVDQPVADTTNPDIPIAITAGPSYAPRGVFGNYFGGGSPTYPARGGFGGNSLISYIGPSVSARPAFNVNLRGRRLRDYIFNR